MKGLTAITYLKITVSVALAKARSWPLLLAATAISTHHIADIAVNNVRKVQLLNVIDNGLTVNFAQEDQVEDGVLLGLKAASFRSAHD